PPRALGIQARTIPVGVDRSRAAAAFGAGHGPSPAILCLACFDGTDGTGLQPAFYTHCRKPPLDGATADHRYQTVLYRYDVGNERGIAARCRSVPQRLSRCLGGGAEMDDLCTDVCRGHYHPLRCTGYISGSPLWSKDNSNPDRGT